MAQGLITNSAFTAYGQIKAHEVLHIGEFVTVVYSEDGGKTAAPAKGGKDIWFVDAAIDSVPEEMIADKEYEIAAGDYPVLKKLYPGCFGITTAVGNYSAINVNDVLMVDTNKTLAANDGGAFTVAVVEKIDDYGGEQAIRFCVLD